MFKLFQGFNGKEAQIVNLSLKISNLKNLVLVKFRLHYVKLKTT